MLHIYNMQLNIHVYILRGEPKYHRNKGDVIQNNLHNPKWGVLSSTKMPNVFWDKKKST